MAVSKYEIIGGEEGTLRYRRVILPPDQRRGKKFRLSEVIGPDKNKASLVMVGYEVNVGGQWQDGNYLRFDIGKTIWLDYPESASRSIRRKLERLNPAIMDAARRLYPPRSLL